MKKIKVCGVYAIRHTPSGRMYVGSSVNVAARQRQHFSDLRHGRHPNIYLQRSFKKHGEKEFEWVLLETMQSDESLKNKEEKWIKDLETLSTQKGYNIASDTTAPRRGMKVSEQTRKRMSESLCGEKHPLAIMTQEKIEEVFNLHNNGYTQIEIGRIVGTDNSNVSLILRGMAWKHLIHHTVLNERTNNASGCVGVYYDKRVHKWKAEIIVDKKYHGLGYYENIVDAIAARKKAEEVYLGV